VEIAEDGETHSDGESELPHTSNLRDRRGWVQGIDITERGFQDWIGEIHDERRRKKH
jgi:hypothetical protein